tara:strand:+ start:64 stop:309 length:246 start_codon:yes stop_codon:yes gene_type:complete
VSKGFVLTGDLDNYSLLVESTPCDITTTTKQYQRENHLAEGQKDDSANADKTNLFDHGLTLVSHCLPLDTSHEEADREDTF